MTQQTARRSETIPATGRIGLAPGNFFFLLNASANISITFDRGGVNFGAADIGAGYVKGNVREWDRAVITGPAGTTVQFFYGTEDLSEDFTDFRAQIATISGVTAVAEQPAASIVSTASAALATGNSLDISANLARRRITICNESTSGGSVWVRDQLATTNAGEELQPGTSKEFKGTYALRVRNNSGFSANISTNEES